MGKNKKRVQEVPVEKADRVTPWNALLKLPEKQRYRLYAFLVWLLGIFIILWVFRS